MTNELNKGTWLVRYCLMKDDRIKLIDLNKGFVFMLDCNDNVIIEYLSDISTSSFYNTVKTLKKVIVCEK